MRRPETGGVSCRDHDLPLHVPSLLCDLEVRHEEANDDDKSSLGSFFPFLFQS